MFNTNVKMTLHASVRCQQRSIPDFAIDALHAFGTRRPSAGDAYRWYFDKRGWKKLLTYFGTWAPCKLGQLRKAEMIEASDGSIITVQYRR